MCFPYQLLFVLVYLCVPLALRTVPFIRFHTLCVFPFFKKRLYLFIFEEGEGRAKERERNIDPLCTPSTLTRDPTRTFALQEHAHPTEPHQPGHFVRVFIRCVKSIVGEQSGIRKLIHVVKLKELN